MMKNQKMKITDPYLKERVKLSGETRSGKGWLIWLMLLAILGGGGYYFYPQLQPHVQPLLAQAQEQITTLMEKATSEQLPAEEPTPTVVAANQNLEAANDVAKPAQVVTETEAQPQNSETAEPETSQPQEMATPPVPVKKPEPVSESSMETVATSKPEARNVTESQPVVVVVDQPSEDTTTKTSNSKKPAIEKTPLSEVAVTTALPHETPIEATTQPNQPEVSTTDKSIEQAAQPAKPELTTQQKNQVKRLMSKAKVQLRRLRLTKPSGDNAYETYQALQKLDEEKANEVLTSIVAWYQTEAQKNLKEGWIAYPVKRNAMLIYQRLQKLAPEHEGTKKLLADILTALKARVDIHLERNNILKPKNDNAYVNAKLMYNAAPQHEITQASLDDVEKRMLRIADRQIAQRKFTTPEDDSAYQTYLTMLKMNPDSQNAKQAIEALATRYYDLAMKRKRQGRKTAAISLMERGLGIMPEHEKLNQLKQELGN